MNALVQQADDEQVDLVIVGSGAGALCAALVSLAEGKRVLVLEKEPLVGGTSARSGGAVWIPGNHLLPANGVHDNKTRALQYIEACVKERTPAASLARIEAYLDSGPEMLQFLERLGLKFRHALGYSDYYDTLPGGEPLGRAVEAELLDARELGDWAEKLNRYAMFSMPVRVSEFAALSNVTRTMSGRIAGMRLGFRLLLQKLRRAQILGQGAALQGRLLQQVLRRGGTVRLSIPVKEFMFEGGRVTGVIAAGERGDLRIRARLGVLLNAGGFSRNLEMRQRYLPAPQESVDYSLVNPGDTGEIMQIAIDAGAALDQMNEAWWIVGGVLPNGMAVSHTIDLSKPHCIMVDASGERYVNEAMAYMELGQTMYARQSKAGSIPSWAIFDSRHRERYTWGMAMPGEPPREWLECGYMQRADSLRELAQKCDLDPRKLAATVERFNGFASSGVDADFGRGSRAYERMNGDPTCKPNPTLGSIERPPFHAVRIFVGDVGTCGGLVTDEHGRVLQTDGAAIPGLYACGNIAANCMGRSYPGPGITLGQSMIFGYRAARHALAGGR